MARSGTRKRRKHISRPPGLPPGTIVVASDSPPPTIHVFGYGPDELAEVTVESVADLAALRGRWPVLWVNVNGVGDADVLTEIGKLFELHPLAMEDVSHTVQRPKVEVYPNALFVILHMLSWQVVAEELDQEQLAVFLGKGFVVSFQERTGDPFDPVRERLRKGRPMLRNSGADYLAYALLDAVVDHLFPVMQQFGDVLEDLEDVVLERPTRQTLGRIRQSRRTLIGVRRAVWPLRDAVSSLQGEHLPFITADTRLYVRDMLDHVLRIIDLVESSRDEVNGLMEGYVSSVSLRMNEVMGMLTLVGTIFLPLSFLTGLYGMNFDGDISPYNMPELRMTYGYPALWGVMLLVAAGLMLYFWHRGWFAVVGAAQDSQNGEPPG